MYFQSIPNPSWLFLYRGLQHLTLPLESERTLDKSFMSLLVSSSDFLGNMLQERVAVALLSCVMKVNE